MFISINLHWGVAGWREAEGCFIATYLSIPILKNIKKYTLLLLLVINADKPTEYYYGFFYYYYYLLFHIFAQYYKIINKEFNLSEICSGCNLRIMEHGL